MKRISINNVLEKNEKLLKKIKKIKIICETKQEIEKIPKLFPRE